MLRAHKLTHTHKPIDHAYTTKLAYTYVLRGERVLRLSRKININIIVIHIRTSETNWWGGTTAMRLGSAAVRSGGCFFLFVSKSLAQIYKKANKWPAAQSMQRPENCVYSITGRKGGPIFDCKFCPHLEHINYITFSTHVCNSRVMYWLQ